MDVREFDFDLPPELIAQEPPALRGSSRLLHLDRRTGTRSPTPPSTVSRSLLREGDVVVVNNTRVFPARLLGRRVPSGGAVECLLVRRVGRVGPGRWGLRAGRSEKLAGADAPGTEAGAGRARRLRQAAHALFHGEVLERRFHGRRVIRLWTDDGSPIEEAVDAIGHVPLPPYIKRDDRPDDRERYQTVFARARGSVAAPTAGLHFTPALVSALTARGVQIAEITLHVGYGTFQPVRVERVEDHRLEAERYEVSPSRPRRQSRGAPRARRVVAVGTTTTRTLEAVARAHEGRIVAGRRRDRPVHLPGLRVPRRAGPADQLSPAAIVAAHAGVCVRRQGAPLMAPMPTAIAGGYRFYSYGDAMLVT